MRTFIILFLFSFSAFATSWEQLRPGNDYKLSQSFQLPQDERSGSLIDFMKGDDVTLNEIVPLAIPGGFNMMLYIFDYKNCPGMEMTTDIEIVPVQGTSPVVKAGTLLENCELKVYIELKDYYSQSLFE